MEKDRVIVILREHAPEPKKAGVKHLRVFGSVARYDNSASSDVDLLADFDKSSPEERKRASKVSQIPGISRHTRTQK